MKTPHRFAGLLFAALTSFSLGAGASGLKVARFGGEDGHPTTASATAIYYNPAALTLGEGSQVYLEGQLGFLHMHYDRPAAPTDVPEPAGGEGANVGEAELTQAALVPGIGAKTHLGSWAFGLGVHVPFGAVARFDRNDRFRDSAQFPSAYDGVQRWSVVSGSASWTYLTAAAAYSFDVPRLSVGLAANLIHGSLIADVSRTAAGNNDLTAETRWLTDVSAWQWSLGVGLLFEAIEDQLFLGASYQSPPQSDVLGGKAHHSVGGTITTDEVDLDNPMPDVVRLGARYVASESLELRLFGDYTRWSRHDNVCLGTAGDRCAVRADGSPAEGAHVLANLPREWNDAFGVRAGVSVWPAEMVEVFAGAGFDSNAVPDSTLGPSSMLGAYISVAAGARVDVTDWLRLGAQYTHLQYLSRDNVGESRLPTYAVPSRAPDSGGTYDQWGGLVHVSAAAAF